MGHSCEVRYLAFQKVERTLKNPRVRVQEKDENRIGQSNSGKTEEAEQIEGIGSGLQQFADRADQKLRQEGV